MPACISNRVFPQRSTMNSTETFAPPQYRSALYQVVARIPGVELMGSVNDPAGRPGIGVAATWNASDYRSRYELPARTLPCGGCVLCWK